MKSYCVKQKKETSCVPGSERYVKAKNGRTMMKCKCAECGITKTRFVKTSKGKGIGEFINKGIASQIPGFSAAQEAYKMIPGVDKKLLDRYWSGDIAKGAFNTKTGLFSKKFWTRPPERHDPNCDQIVYDKKSGKWVNKYCD